MMKIESTFQGFAYSKSALKPFYLFAIEVVLMYN